MKLNEAEARAVLRGSPEIAWEAELKKNTALLETIEPEKLSYTQGRVAMLREVIGLREKAERQLK